MAANPVHIPVIDEALEREAEKILAEAGLSLAQAYRGMLRRIVTDQYVSLDLFAPNAETLEAMAALDRGEYKSFNTVEELMADLNADD